MQQKVINKILGNILYKKFDRVCDALQTVLNNDQLQLDETTEKLLSQLRERNKIVSLDLKQFVETYLIEIASLTDKRDTSKHEQQITVWRRERQE
ncbi:unnamed protein product [Rotaria sp. Silwood1]|nr:unnamed protein product [Rotaria sp. Silwood1]